MVGPRGEEEETRKRSRVQLDLQPLTFLLLRVWQREEETEKMRRGGEEERGCKPETGGR